MCCPAVLRGGEVMRVYIDGRSISHPRRGGFKTYVENLIAVFAAAPEGYEFTVIYERPHEFPPIACNPLFRQVVIPARVSMIGQVYREQVALPAYARRQPAALWHFPYNTAPWSGIDGYVLTLHDMTAFTHPARPDWSRPLRALRDLAIFYYPRLLIRRAARRARAVITVSQYARERMVEILGVPEQKVFVTPLAAQPLFRPLSTAERQRAREALTENHGLSGPFLLTVASSLLKNPQGVVEAYARLPAEVRDRHSLVIVMAHQRVRAAVEALAHRLGVDRQIRILTEVESSELLRLYNVAEVLVYPSFTESFPLPTAEAMACGTPVICSNTTGFPEQVGEAAITVTPADLDQLVSALSRVLSSADLRLQMAQAGLRRSQRYSWQRTAEMTREIYDAVLSGETENGSHA
jgi:glycosyltransferase involved in cell wall biosynthesis